MHILIIILIRSFAYTSWSVTGRFGLVSRGHGGIMGIGTYATARAWNDEDGAAATGVHVTREKLKVTVLSAAMTALAGAVYCQYQLFISPDTVSGIAVSLQMVFAVVVGGIYVPLGPTVGAVITIMLAEVLRVSFGTRAVGWDNLVYGILLVIFIILLPKGILGSLLALRRAKARRGRRGVSASARSSRR